MTAPRPIGRAAGISVFPGFGPPLDEIVDYVQRAARLGFREVFTSLHLPETEWETVAAGVQAVAAETRRLDLRLTADISHVTFDHCSASPIDLAPLVALGLDRVRPDYGFSLGELAAMAGNDLGLGVVLNAGRLDADELAALAGRGAALEGVPACHNYYPRPESGLSLPLVAARGDDLHRLGLTVWAFVASQDGRRGPAFEGLPTVEEHRSRPAHLAAESLFASHGVDVVLFGDAPASQRELEHVAETVSRHHVRLRLEMAEGVSTLERETVGGVREVWDLAPRLVRASNDTVYHREREIEPRPPAARPAYSVTIDNRAYGRFAGGLNVCLVDLPPDPRVNVIGRIVAEDQSSVDCLRIGDQFELARADAATTG